MTAADVRAGDWIRHEHEGVLGHGHLVYEVLDDGGSLIVINAVCAELHKCLTYTYGRCDRVLASSSPSGTAA